MSLFISDAYAQAAGASQQGSLMSLLPLVAIFIVFYFLLIRPQQKRAKEHKKMTEAIAKGDEVVTTGGTLGKVTRVGESFITVEVAAGVEIKVQRAAIQALMPKGTIKSA
ncbi:MAG: preprotein translocase subunit YajC [Gammaproteobacteria bacterium]|nr:preprotein translocase subunit YajC [Gammaproteobacteria bacterium]